MADTFVTVEDIMSQWAFSGSADPNGPTRVRSDVMTHLRGRLRPLLSGGTHPSAASWA